VKRRYTKHSRRQLQLQFVQKAKKTRDEARFPYLGRFRRREEFLKVFGTTRQHPRSLFLDLDGTLIRLYPGRRSHRTPEFRPHFEDFIAAAGQFANLFVFSATNPVRLRHIADRFLGSRFTGFLDHRFMSRRKKNIDWLAQVESEVLIVDDMPWMVSKWSQKYLVPVSAWKGDKNGAELLSELARIRQKWNLLA